MDEQRAIIKELTRYKGIVFDLDGTLIDLGVDWVALKQELSAYCRKEKAIEMEFTPLDQKVHEAKRKFGHGFFLQLIEKISEYELHEEKYRINTELIQFLNQSGSRKVAIYSMNTKKCVENAVARYLKKKPESIVAKETCIEPKPTEKDLLRILSEWNLASHEVAYVGNSEGDRLSGEKAGIKTYIIHF